MTTGLRVPGSVHRLRPAEGRRRHRTSSPCTFVPPRLRG